MDSTLSNIPTPPLNEDKPLKILIIRFSSIGDIVLMTPVFRCIKTQLPNVEIHFLTKIGFKAVTVANPYIDYFHYFENDFNALKELIKTEKFDYVIDLHKNLRTLRLKRYRPQKTQWLSFPKLSIEKWLLTQLRINIISKKHITQRSLEAVRALGVKDDGKGLDYFIPPDSEINIQTDLPLSHQMGYVAIVIGASYYTKKLPAHKLQALCNLISHPIVLVGGKEDAAAGEIIASVDTGKVYNACGKFSLNESADIVRRAKLVISHDTGLQYVACAFQKPVLAIWGGTSPKLAVEPYYGTALPAKHVNFIVAGLRCQPCSNYGLKSCPKKHFNCMELQNLEAIAQSALHIIKN